MLYIYAKNPATSVVAIKSAREMKFWCIKDAIDSSSTVRTTPYLETNREKTDTAAPGVPDSIQMGLQPLPAYCLMGASCSLGTPIVVQSLGKGKRPRPRPLRIEFARVPKNSASGQAA